MNLNQVTIASLDVAKSTEFYKTLGLKLIVDALPRYVRLECPDGESTFSISKVDSLPEGNKITLYFEVDNLSKTVLDLRQKGITFNTEITEQSWLWTDINLTDPDGHKLIIFYAGKNRKNPPWRVN
ncbi:VOC family protein [Winogradskyella echinorum]|uniref:VOC family protein n=1 Tax=Winogradskyella echinorum TaxID=538189 RepID=A0ABR6XWX5_9FLAO|nr:VOC family protein [Winogradskyella echinorum]MBC3844889.1 VOC family protein [Winogradskyella echinorum]MBC5749237.1 VOC family protein [Winogradskyella echinorum]